MIRGSCLCGTVRWSYKHQFERMTHCHCAMCRKAHGSAFATYAVGPSASFEFACNTSDIGAFESSPGFIRSFCRHCGSVVPNNHLGEIVAVPVGSIDGSPGRAPDGHIFVRWKAPWYTINDTLPQHNNYPDQAEPAVDRPSAAASADGKLRGSCLCDTIHYEIAAQLDPVYHCHCSRCRKARAAAHSSNGRVALKHLRFTQGDDALTTFKLPQAKYFSQTFCRSCGSAMPLCDQSRDLAVVPLGSLHDRPPDPGYHIFTASRAAWFVLADGLPQFSGAPAA